MELFNIQLPGQSSGNELSNAVQLLRQRSDAFHSSGEKIIALENGATTELLTNLENKNNQTYNIPLSIVSLHIQCKCLNSPSLFFAYFISCKRFVDNLSPEIAQQFFMEGYSHLFSVFLFLLFLFIVEEIFHSLCELACAANSAKSVVNSLKKAITLACPHLHIFSPLYADFLQCCIKGQLYGVALDFIRKREVFEITSRINGFAEDFLKFFYYSGIW
jgi:hypothetical protein